MYENQWNQGNNFNKNFNNNPLTPIPIPGNQQ